MTSRTLTDDSGQATKVTLARLTVGFQSVLEVSPQLGHAFPQEDFDRESTVVMLSNRFWRSRYGGRSDALGKTLHIRDEPHAVVGVLQAGQEFPQEADLWRPIRASEIEPGDREFLVIGRLKSEVSVEQAQEETAVLVSRVPRDPEEGQFSAWIQPLQSMMVGEVETPLLLLLGAVPSSTPAAGTP